MMQADGEPGGPSEAGRRDRAGDARDDEAGARDVAGDERDQAGGERDDAADLRDDAAERRDLAGDRRDEAADQRDLIARQRDQLADERDLAATLRDDASVLGAEQSEHAAIARNAAAEDRLRAAEDRQAGAYERSFALHDRGTASGDRRSGATERIDAERDRQTSLSDRGSGADARIHAELDRQRSQGDRGASAADREHASLDALTGAYVRSAGVLELDRELSRARRTDQSFVLAFIDVDRLKTVNDRGGHAAGDRVLALVAATLRSKLRSYDLLVRYGGDEFICALSGVGTVEATRRLTSANEILRASAEPASMTFGLAEAAVGEMLEAVISRADASLYAERGRRRGAGRKRKR